MGEEATPETEVNVTVEAPPTEEQSLSQPSDAERAAAAAHVAETVAAGVVAIAEQQAAQVQMDAAQEVAEHQETVEEHDRSIDALWQTVNNLPSLISQTVREAMDNLKAELSTPPPSLEEPAAIVETTTLTIPSDTSAPTSETQTEVIAESVNAEVPAQPEAPPKKRRFRII